MLLIINNKNMTDYLGRTTSIEFNAINNKMAESTHKGGLNGEYDPFKITYFAHPTREDKLYVTKPPELITCNMCDENHKTYIFSLEKGYTVMYCHNYKGGNWIFLK